MEKKDFCVFCRLVNDEHRETVGEAPRPRGGRQPVYGCTVCGRHWLRTEWGWTSYEGELLKEKKDS